jgi:hypothetical protein
VKNKQKGTVLLEFVLSTFVLVMVFAMLCNCAFLLREKIAVASAAREAGRQAAVTKDMRLGIEVGERVMVSSGVPESRFTVRVYQAAQNLIASEVTCDSPLLLPMIGGLLGDEWSPYLTFHKVLYFRYEETPQN